MTSPTESKAVVKDIMKEHRDNCPICQAHNFCQVSHDMLLKEAGYKPKKKENQDETLLR
jgi:hypothetical protein